MIGWAVKRRFIPAGAGNRRSRFGHWRDKTVHPRGRGEQVAPSARRISICGSSPRARGTVIPDPERRGLGRFIPAGAGNRCQDHKRAARPCGSSPRARGTGGGVFLVPFESRFIPAGAGNRTRNTILTKRTSVHPRGRGEQDAAECLLLRRLGSSPRARGTAGRTPGAAGQGRFIPAGAGNS